MSDRKVRARRYSFQAARNENRQVTATDGRESGGRGGGGWGGVGGGGRRWGDFWGAAHARERAVRR